MSFIDFLPALSGILSLALGVIILSSGAARTSLRLPFAVFTTGVGVWGIFITLFLATENIDTARIYATIYYIAALLIGYGFLLFSLAYSSIKVSFMSMIGIAIPFIGMTIVTLIPSLLMRSITTHGEVVLSMGVYVLYSVIFLLYALSGLLVLFLQLSKQKKAEDRRSRAIFISMLAVSMVGGGYFNLILPGFGNYSLIAWGPVFILLMVSSVAYAIVRHGLFDIKSAVIRSVSYGLVLSSLAVVYYFLAYGLSVLVVGGAATTEMSVGPVNVVLALVLAVLFQPFKRFFDRLTNGLFYRDSYSTQDFYEEFNATVRSQGSLEQLMSRSSEVIRKTLKSEYVGMIVYREGGSFDISGAGKYKKIPLVDAHRFDSFRHPVHVEGDIENSLLRVMMSHRISVAVPLYIDNVFMGLIYIGDRLTSRYTKRDIRTLTVVAGELVVGVQNALAVQEIRDLNDNLQHKIDLATKELRRSNAQLQRLDEAKDEFISMASHQLRTPLTSIKGYISMLMDGDLGKISPQQHQVLEEAFTSSERMVRLIADFLNVSRLQTGKFVIEKKPVDLASLVEHEVKALHQNAAARNLSFVYKKPANIPLLELDENKIQQVVMNFADNAIYYSKEGGIITVALKKTREAIEFTVKDTGIGVPEEEQARLFNKFFRAANARQQRPDGTGVGIFLAKKVVKDHGGEIIFSSVEGKGSTFGFRLPLPKKK